MKRSEKLHQGPTEAQLAAYEAAQLDAKTQRCADCGKRGERTGHMDCQYPQDRE